MKKRNLILLFLAVILIISFSQFVIKAEENTYDTVVFNEEEKFEVLNKDENLYIKAEHFAGLLDMRLEIEEEGIIFMNGTEFRGFLLSKDSTLVFIGDKRLILSDYPVKLVNGKGYVLLDQKLFNKLGLILDYQEDNREIHIFEPKFYVSEFNFQDKKIEIKINEIPPYRIAVNEGKLIIEFQKTKIGDNFDSFIDNRRYNLEAEQNNTLKLKFKSSFESVLPKHEGVYEENNSLFIELVDVGVDSLDFYLSDITEGITTLHDKIYFSKSQFEKDSGGISVKFTLIHPNKNFPYRPPLPGILKENYNLVLAEFRLRETTFEDFNLYDFKNNSKLTVDGETVESVDFFDISFSPRGRAYWDTDYYTYRARGSVRITGYLLFPKIIDENSKDIRLEGDNKSIFFEQGVRWDFEKINDFIEIKKN